MNPLEYLESLKNKFEEAIDIGGTRAAPGSKATQLKLNIPKVSAPKVNPASAALGGAVKAVGGAAALYTGYNTAKDLVESLQRGEGYAAIPGLVNNFLSGPKATDAPGGRQYDPSAAMPKKSVAGLPADYKETEQQAINNALMLRGQQSRQKQITDGVIPGTLPNGS